MVLNLSTQAKGKAKGGKVLAPCGKGKAAAATPAASSSAAPPAAAAAAAANGDAPKGKGGGFKTKLSAFYSQADKGAAWSKGGAPSPAKGGCSKGAFGKTAPLKGKGGFDKGGWGAGAPGKGCYMAKGGWGAFPDPGKGCYGKGPPTATFGKGKGWKGYPPAYPSFGMGFAKGMFGMKGKAMGLAKGKGKGKRKGTGHKLPRERITETPVTGSVVEWKGKYGWLQPSVPIEHEKAQRHEGRVFVSSSDIGDLPGLTVGNLCQFHVFADASGLGAEECISS